MDSIIKIDGLQTKKHQKQLTKFVANVFKNGFEYHMDPQTIQIALKAGINAMNMMTNIHNCTFTGEQHHTHNFKE